LTLESMARLTVTNTFMGLLAPQIASGKMGRSGQ